MITPGESFAKISASDNEVQLSLEESEKQERDMNGGGHISDW